MPDLYRIAWPLVSLLEPETGHRAALAVLKAGVGSGLFADRFEHPSLETTVFGRRFANPIGLAAGFDKHAEVIAPCLALGFGFVELGGVTPQPQTGNPRPRLFRLTEDEAIINRMGFNSDGLAAFARRLAAWRAGGGAGVVAVNLGKNKTSDDAAADYAAGVGALAHLADLVVINVSSPNTPGLRALQSVAPLIAIIRAAQASRPATASHVPLLLKIAPDLTDDDVADLCRVALDERIDGLVVSNTTTARPAALRSIHRNETGGLSGRPLFAPSTALLARVFAATGGRLPLIGVGGVGSGADAYAKIRAGASLVQLYSALVFHGPALVGRIKRELAALLARDGFAHVADAVGTAKA
ncbi:MAG: quinone-dependent dihydroorotate dehydrogenase [Rhodospirillaceae bacterium]|nr:quinone-dependent dihydroorotate dehydrogenase [Rhodospirillaceae bacterium]